jgi:transposase
MLNFALSTKIYLIAGVTDMRKSFDGLAAIVSGTLQQDPYSGHAFIFSNRLRNRLKILLWDRSGFWVLAKRLEKGTFAWPTSASATVEMTPEELSLLLGGIDLRGSVRRRWYERPPLESEKKILSR